VGETVVGIQYLRGLAAVFVVVDHVATMMGMPQYFGRGPSQSLVFGQIGVDIFFVISGFIITLVSLGPDLEPRLTLTEFLRRRFVRIVPFLWVCVIGYAAFRLIGRGSFEVGPYLRAMTLWPVGEVRPNVVWTLRHEALFYLIFGVAMLGTVRRPLILLLWFASPFLCAVFELLAPLPQDVAGELVAIVASPVNVEFALGVGVGALYVRRSYTPLLSARPGPVLVTVAATGVFVLAVVFDLHRNLRDTSLLGLASAAVVCYGIGARRGGIVGALGELLGNASYSIYLTHNVATLGLYDAWARLSRQSNVYVVEVVGSILAIASGVAVHLFVEKPVVRFARNVLHPRSVRVGTPST
jgi:exopolysaccharide production protein ExoZ